MYWPINCNLGLMISEQLLLPLSNPWKVNGKACDYWRKTGSTSFNGCRACKMPWIHNYYLQTKIKIRGIKKARNKVLEICRS